MSVDTAVNARPQPYHAAAIQNPRRQPASNSVSLKHTPSAKANSRAHTASSLVNNNGSPAGSSNSQTWFDTSNNNPVPRRSSPIDRTCPAAELHTSPADKPHRTLDEPPFFLPDSSSATPHNNNSRGAPSAAQHLLGPTLMHRDAVEDNMNDFRSVIDDLTIQNKKLLKRLRLYERADTHHLHSERLFEVKFHGLSASKKHELEETLKRFALGLVDASSPGSRNAGAATVAPVAIAPKPSSSHTSTKFADSGYGSMTASNRSLTQRSASSNLATGAGQSGAEALRARERNIHSYLHDIPEGLLPSQSPSVMTEDTKKRLIVSRLEQLFHGSGAAADGHQQPIQQQEVSQLAAKDDRSAMEARGQRAQAEGRREAPIMNEDSDATANAEAAKIPTGASEAGIARTGHSSSATAADSGVLEQRPTRPLDLDPHRAQDPSENLGYIRHLGFQMSEWTSHGQPDDSQGWIYLNLLVSMAQLHTLNVTTSLVTDALRSYSSKFELSEDCRKIRWHPSGLRDAPAPDLAHVDAAIAPHVPAVPSLKRSRPPHLDSLSSQYESHPPKKRSISRAASSKMSYTPLAPNPSERNLDHDEEKWADSSDREDSLASVAEYPDDSPLDPMDAVMSESTPSQDAGALIFLNNPRFFLDLSGNRAKQDFVRSNDHPQTVNARPLGSRSIRTSSPGAGTCTDATTSSQLAASDCGSLEVHTDEGIRSKDDHASDDHSRPSTDSSPTVVHLEASGLGCVYPSDNFVIFVTRDVGEPSTFKDMQEDKAGLPPKRRASLPQVLSVKQHNLNPSRLPSPTYAVTPDDDDDEDDDLVVAAAHDIDVSSSEGDSLSESYGSGSEASSQSLSQSPLDPHGRSPPHLPRDKSDSRQTSDEDDNFDAQSLDFLATARAVDPAAIQAREREYDAELAERLAEVIPAGSSAATCGGGYGSGYNSPATGIRRILDRKGMAAPEPERDGVDGGNGSVSS